MSLIVLPNPIPLKNVLTLLLLAICVNSLAQDDLLESSDLPIFIISTTDGGEIPNEPKTKAHLGIIYNGESVRNHIDDPFNEYDGDIAIEIRGNGSVFRDKVSYSFETQDDNGENNNVSILGFPEENDWILYAPETDKTFMRNVLAYELANKMGYYASRTQFCELIVNDEYLGVFVFMEKIKRDKNRVDISKFTEENTEEPSEGGFIVRIDSWWEENRGWESESYLYQGEEVKIRYQYYYPKPDEISESQSEYIQEYIQNFENDLYYTNIIELKSVYTDYIDLNNFADYFIINELSKNPDGYRLSTFLHKDSEAINNKLKLGPIWDYNFGFGNYCCDYHQDVSGWEYDNTFWEFPSQMPFWITKLMNSPDFFEHVHDRWLMWREDLISCDSFQERIDHWSTVVDEAKERNYVKWPILGTNVVWEWNAGPIYEDETDFLKDWICDRIEWMDQSFLKRAEEYNANEMSLFPNPCPSNSTCFISINSSKNRLINFSVFNIHGAQIIQERRSVLAGQNFIPFNVSILSGGIYFIAIDDKPSLKLIVQD